MISKKLLDILACPISHNSLVVASEEIIASVNGLIRKKKCYTAVGKNVKSPIEQALYDPKSLNLYKVENNIPILLVDEAIKLPYTLNETPSENK